MCVVGLVSIGMESGIFQFSGRRGFYSCAYLALTYFLTCDTLSQVASVIGLCAPFIFRSREAFGIDL